MDAGIVDVTTGCNTDQKDDEVCLWVFICVYVLAAVARYGRKFGSTADVDINLRYLVNLC